MMKFSTLNGIGELWGDEQLAGECYMETLWGETLKESRSMEELDV